VPGMSGWLALVGGAEWTKGCTFDEALLARSQTSVVTVLPTAAAFENPTAAVTFASQWFATFGASVEVCDIRNRTDADNPALAQQLREAKFVYVAGGSPMHLRSVLKDTLAYEALREGWRSGNTLAASSAGAMALCDPMLDPRGGAFGLGLGLIEGLAVLPHAGEWSAERTKRTLKLLSANIQLAVIDERTALVRSPEGSWNAEGAGTVRIHANGADTSDLHVLDALTVK
jgi:cyanophycinase